MKLWQQDNTTDTVSYSERLTLLNITGAETALDLANNRIVSASSESWRYIGWRYHDEETGKPRILPAEHFGPLPI